MVRERATQASGRRQAERVPQPSLGSRYWRLWASSGLSNLADGILKVALPLVAVRVTDSPTLIAGLVFALTLPWLLFALPAGALADRLDRRRAMLVANGIRALLLVVLALAFVVDLDSIWVLYAVAVCIGMAETVYDTSAQSILPLLVPRDLLSRANGRLHAAELTANEFLGPPVGGLLVAAGVAMAFATPAGLWLVAIAALLLVRGRYRVERTAPTTMRADVLEGLRFLWRNRLLRTLAVMVGVFNFAGNATWAILVLYAVGPTSAMKLPDPAFGLLLTASAAGSLLGALIADRVERRLGRARSLGLTVFGSALSLGTPAATANPYLVGGAFFIGGVVIALWNVITVSLRQRVTPDRLLGRVNSGYRLLAWGTIPLGAVAGGLLAQATSLRTVFVVAAVLILGLLVLLRTVTDKAIDAAEREAAAER